MVSVETGGRGEKPKQAPITASSGLRSGFFYLYLVESRLRSAITVNRAPATDDSTGIPNFRDGCALSLTPQRMEVMDRGDIVGGSKPTRKAPENPQGLIVSTPAGRSEPAPGNVGNRSGAMSQQRCDNGATSTPQQLVHLVGCRDRKPGRQQG
jgi:hypothetical protein